MERVKKDIFDKVLIIGPDYKSCQGGIASVMASYAEYFEPFHFSAVNHGGAKALSYLAFAKCFITMPFKRLAGRKIAHIHYAIRKSWPRENFLGVWARLLGFRTVMHCHSGEMKVFCEQRGIDYVHKVLDKATAHIVLSESWHKFFTEEIKCRNIHIVNNIVSRPQIKSKAEKQEGPTEFLFLGTIGDNKGIFDVLAAAENLVKRGFDFRLVVGGNGETERFHTEVVRRGLESKVDFRGWVTGDEKNKAMERCDVLVLPSHNEGLPISILEAMSYGKSVLTTRVGGIPEIISDRKNGLFVTPGNVAEIENAMQRYIEDPDLARIHGKNSAAIIEKFYPEIVANQLESIYTSLL